MGRINAGGQAGKAQFGCESFDKSLVFIRVRAAKAVMDVRQNECPCAFAAGSGGALLTGPSQGAREENRVRASGNGDEQARLALRKNRPIERAPRQAVHSARRLLAFCGARGVTAVFQGTISMTGFGAAGRLSRSRSLRRR